MFIQLVGCSTRTKLIDVNFKTVLYRTFVLICRAVVRVGRVQFTIKTTNELTKMNHFHFEHYQNAKCTTNTFITASTINDFSNGKNQTVLMTNIFKTNFCLCLCFGSQFSVLRYIKLTLVVALAVG